MSIIRLENISKSFKNNKLYEKVDFEVNACECVGLVGANGSGKSVLFQMIMGILKQDEGSIYVRDKLVDGEVAFPENVGILVNQPGYISNLTGLANLMILAEIRNLVDETHIRSVMERVGLDPDNKTKVKHYSTGMKQKLGISQAIMENQDIVLLDEPFNGLDYETTGEVLKILRGLKNSGITLVLTSHQQDLLEKVCDRMYLISGQRILPLTQDTREKYFNY